MLPALQVADAPARSARSLTSTSNPGLASPAGRPDAQNLYDVAVDPEVEPVLRSAHEVAANLDGSTRFNPVTETRVSRDDEQHGLEVQTDRAGSRGSVLSPPMRKAFELADSASLDEERKRCGYP